MSPAGLSAHGVAARRIAAALAAAAAAAAAFAPVAAAKPPVTIAGNTIQNYRFSPHKIMIKKRKTVTWSWDSNQVHNVTFTKPHKASENASQGEFSLKFKKAGKFKYMCTIHGFGGKVVVK